MSRILQLQLVSITFSAKEGGDIYYSGSVSSINFGSFVFDGEASWDGKTDFPDL